MQANVAKQADIERLFAEAKTAFGRLDILVNNAGIYEFAPLEQVTEEHFHSQFDLNVLGLILTTQEAVKHFGAEGGSIINISSVASTAAPPNASVYSATKAAVDAVTRSLAKELGPRKIRVNSINPGMVETEGVQGGGHPRERLPQAGRRPRRRWAGSASRRTSRRPRCSWRRPIRRGSPARRCTSRADCADLRRFLMPGVGVNEFRPLAEHAFRVRHASPISVGVGPPLGETAENELYVDYPLEGTIGNHSRRPKF